MSSLFRSKILELFDESLVGKDQLIVDLVNWMSESDAKEFFEYYTEDGSEVEEYLGYDSEISDDDQPIWATKFVPGVARF